MARIWTFAALLILSGLIGCGKPPAPQFRFNQVELLKQERLTLPSGQRFDAKSQEQIKRALLSLFGTPDSPRLPKFRSDNAKTTEVGDLRADENEIRNDLNSADGRVEIFNLNNLEHAAGAVRSDKDGKSFGLYREHCANCHGLSGDGAGVTAGFLDPYPRDFRLGKFKFKSTPLRQAPTHADLDAVLVNGIPGTAMPSFRRLKVEERKAILDYVRYLSVRGQTERYLITSLAQNGGEPILGNWRAKENSELTDNELNEIASQARDYIGEDVLKAFFVRWMEAESKITAVPDPPRGLQFTGPPNQTMVEQGRELYFKKGNCAECHGEAATGGVATIYYDDWTNDWIKSTGIDLQDKVSYRPFLKAGALPPRPVRPRNLKMAVMRGGEKDEDIYRKIANGIEGTPMPSSAATLSEDEIWALVAYVKFVARSSNQDDPSRTESQ